jgi:hypothetical protein
MHEQLEIGDFWSHLIFHYGQRKFSAYMLKYASGLVGTDQFVVNCTFVQPLSMVQERSDFCVVRFHVVHNYLLQAGTSAKDNI